MIDNQPLVSVCIPVYNGQDCIKETIECVINQTYKNLQIIVVNDCSTDNTLNILNSFKDERLEIYSLDKNRHVGHANNVCLSKVKGSYTAHLDADDKWFPNKIEKQIEFMENHSKYGACFTYVDVIDGKGNKRNEYEEFVNAIKIENHTQAGWIRLFCDKLNCFIHSTCIMKTEILKTVGFHNCAYLFLHDFDYWARIVLKYNIYVIPEPLGEYRIFDDGRNNSNLSSKGDISVDCEYVEIIYHLIDDAPDSLFLDAFKDKLRFKGNHQKIDIEFEKAFILLNAFLRRGENKLLGIRKLTELFTDHNNIKIAEDHFDFTIQDFYKLKEQQIYYDYQELFHFTQTIEEQEQQIKSKNEKISEQERILQSKNEKISEQERIIQSKNQELAAQQRVLGSIYSSRAWKMARCIRFVFRCFKRKKETRMLVYGYPYKNLGDDLFFLTLVRRYPNTIFMFYDIPGAFVEQYRAFFADMQNVIIYSHDEYKIAILNKMGRKFFHKEDFARYALSRFSTGGIQIGGSIFQQFDNWRDDYALRKKRQLIGKPFFTIGCNFGCYSDSAFYKLWLKSIKTYKDICFRDSYSYELFQNLPNARFAPDILFSYKAKEQYVEKKQISISVIQLDTHMRGNLRFYKNQYVSTLAAFCGLAIENGYDIKLISFCEYEQDHITMNEIYENIPDGQKNNCDRINYTQNNLEDVIKALGESEIVLASRFHAMVLGWALKKKVVPIVYSIKTQNVIDDVAFKGPCISIEDFGHLSAYQLMEYAMNSKSLDVSSLARESQKHFAKMDAYLS